jgi:superfamily II DNA or RNA helicase
MKSSWQPMKTLKEFLKRLARFFGVGATGTPDPLTNLARKIEPRATLETIPLAELQKQILNDLSAHARDSRSQSGGETIVLFTGASGSGKTNAAEAVARDLGRSKTAMIVMPTLKLATCSSNLRHSTASSSWPLTMRMKLWTFYGDGFASL